MYPQIQVATNDDVSGILRIAHQYRDELGYVHPVALRGHIAKHTVLVAVQDNNLLGFVDYHSRRDGWQTVYHLATDRAHTAQGVGRQLLYAVPCPIRLKVTADNPANQFYAGAGMQLVASEPGRRQALNIYELRVLGVFCMGNGKGDLFPRIARASGMAYGTRSSEKARAWPYMLDIDWKRYATGKLTWGGYMELVNAYHPIQAMCVDYERPDQRRELYRQIRDLRQAGVLRVMVCPKFTGAVAHIPSWCTVAISIPSSYAGFVPDPAELRGRRVHLLGGTPNKQQQYLIQFQSHGANVISFDGNSHEMAAQRGDWYTDGKWIPKKGKSITNEDRIELTIGSGRNIMRMMQIASQQRQLPIF